MPLGLHRRAHHPEDGPESSVPGSKARDDGVNRTLPRSDGVRVAWFQAEQVAAVVEADTRTLGDDTAAEAFIEAVYERTAVAFRIHRAEVGRVPAGCGLGHALRGVFPRDAPTQVRGVVFRDQTSRRDLLVVPELRVSYLFVEILEGELLRLDLEVDTVRARGFHGGQLESFEDVEHLQGRGALAGGWDLVDPDTSVVGRDRLDEGRLVGREILLREVTSGLLRGARDARCNLAFVESVGAPFGDGRDRGRKVHLGENLPCNRSPAFRQKGPRGGLVCAEYVFVLIPVAGDDLGDGVAILRELPGGLEQTRQGLVPEAVCGFLPQPDSARDRNS